MGKIESSVYKYSTLFQNILFLIGECGVTDISKVALMATILLKSKQQEKIVKSSIDFLSDLIRVSLDGIGDFFNELKRTYQLLFLLRNNHFIEINNNTINIDKTELLEKKCEVDFSPSFREKLICVVCDASTLSIVNEVINYV